MENSIAIQPDVIYFVIVIAVLIVLFFVLLKLIQLINELIKTTKISQTTLEKTNMLIDDADSSLKQVEKIAVDVNKQYFTVVDSAYKVKDQTTDMFSKFFKKEKTNVDEEVEIEASASNKSEIKDSEPNDINE